MVATSGRSWQRGAESADMLPGTDRRAAARPRGSRPCGSARGEWGELCPVCGQQLPPRPDPLASWHAGRATDRVARSRHAPLRFRRGCGTGISERTALSFAAARTKVAVWSHIRPMRVQPAAASRRPTPRLATRTIVGKGSALLLSHMQHGSHYADRRRTSAALTVIATFLARDYVLQVSDMKLTWLDGSVFEDRAAKTVVFCGHFLFSYTGRACIAGLRTDYVIAEVWREPRNSRRRGPIAVGTHETTRSSPAQQRTRGGGRRLGSHVAARQPPPHRCRDIQSRRRRSAGHVFGEGLRNAQLMPAGVARTATWKMDHVVLERQLHRRVNAGSSPSTVAALIVHAVRRLSERNALVGHPLIVSCLPRRAVPAALEWRLGPPQWRDRATFLYVPESLDEARWYGPGAACGGIAAAAPTVSPTDWVGPPRPCPPD